MPYQTLEFDRWQYRYDEWWAGAHSGFPALTCVLMHPGRGVDRCPQIAGCRRLAQYHGLKRVVVVSLFALKTDIDNDIETMPHIQGPDNRRQIAATIGDAYGPVVAAWGTPLGPISRTAVNYFLEEFSYIDFQTIGLNTAGFPKLASQAKERSSLCSLNGLKA